MEYDESDQTIEITGLDELQIYIAQNETSEVKRRRNVREALRALDVPSPNPYPAHFFLTRSDNSGKTSFLDIY